MDKILKRFSIIHRQSSICLGRNLKECQITTGQYLYIMFICENIGFSQEQISCELKIDKGSVARTIKQLEKDGYVTRSILNEDKRTLQVYPTDKAKDKYKEVIKIINEWEQVLTRDLSSMEVNVLVNLLDKIIANIEQK